jgi:SWI/SNF-related matrix-associated actin-dependent regulator 1 of chromatin subfamily A
VHTEALARAEQLACGLFPHQVDGVAFLLCRRRAILADDMGLGKTRQAIAAMTEAAPTGPWLVVCPASVKRKWAREIAMARPSDLVRVVEAARPPDERVSGWLVVNYDILARHQAALEACAWGGVILDEAHYLKNHRSQRSRIARSIVSRGHDTVVYCLTGTPLTNRPRDVFPLMQMVGHPMSRSFLRFAKRYCAASLNDGVRRHYSGGSTTTDRSALQHSPQGCRRQCAGVPSQNRATRPACQT